MPHSNLYIYLYLQYLVQCLLLIVLVQNIVDQSLKNQISFCFLTCFFYFTTNNNIFESQKVCEDFVTGLLTFFPRAPYLSILYIRTSTYIYTYIYFFFFYFNHMFYPILHTNSKNFFECLYVWFCPIERVEQVKSLNWFDLVSIVKFLCTFFELLYKYVLFYILSKVSTALLIQFLCT